MTESCFPRKREWRFRAENMIKICENILINTRGMHEKIFFANRMIAPATLFNLQCLGGDALYLPPKLCASHKEIDWQDLIQLREDLIICFENLDEKKIWHTIQNVVPKLSEALKQMLAETEEGPGLVPRVSAADKYADPDMPWWSGEPKKCDEILKILREQKDHVKKNFLVSELVLYGSFARDEAEADSDVDLLVTFDASGSEDTPFFELQSFLEDALDWGVCLQEKKTLRLELLPYVEKEQIRI